MGGRGSSSGGSSATLTGLLRGHAAGGGGSGASTGQWDSEITIAPYQRNPDYTDNGNAQLVKFQGQTDDKTANFLAGTDRNTDLNAVQQATNDPWAFYDNPQQKLVERIGLNAPTTVLSDSEFNRYVSQTGATVLYRGWSGQNAIDRFNQSPNSHIGTGINGDGYYFAADKSTAQSYGGTGMRAALSPNARVVSIDAVNSAISNASPRLRRSLGIAGTTGSRSYGGNNGQAQMALRMGYNTIDAGWAVIPLTRDAVVVSSRNAW